MKQIKYVIRFNKKSSYKSCYSTTRIFQHTCQIELTFISINPATVPTISIERNIQAKILSKHIKTVIQSSKIRVTKVVTLSWNSLKLTWDGVNFTFIQQPDLRRNPNSRQQNWESISKESLSHTLYQQNCYPTQNGSRIHVECSWF